MPTNPVRWRRHWKTFALGGLILSAIAGGYFYTRSERQSSFQPKAPLSGAVSELEAKFVGTRACAGCHSEEHKAWKGSHHELAMRHANPETVLGSFDNTKFTYAGITSIFFRRDGNFFVNTDGPDGETRDYEIKYTFGVTPLQQYLIEFPDGRIQALSIAWDTRPKRDGGQRWFHLYPNERVTHDDELHWTGPAQNWNFMCADCHSTGLRKNYDPVSDRFKSEWAEINVGCEACHGPGSRHLAWTKAEKAGQLFRDESMGLTVTLDEPGNVGWTLNEATGNAVRSRPRATEREIEVCAQCHARRGQIAEGYSPGKPFFDYYRPALLTHPLYYADGQQWGEVYKWGSFMQSKMFAAGVTCSDCHNPHSGQLRAKGNSVCAACHLSTKYDTAEHHHHKPGSAGAECVACHMPATNYMVVDPRHDHSFRVPQPDLSVKLGTPNACNSCHANRDARWAAAQVNQWYGRTPRGYQRFAEAFAAGDTETTGAQAQLRAIAADSDQSAIVRATALARLRAPLHNAAIEVVAAAARDSSPLVRLGALQSLAGAPPEARVRLAAPLLSDPLKSIRVEAANVLAPVPVEQMGAAQRAAFGRASAEYLASQRYNADRADARVNLGTFYAERGEPAKGEAEMKAAMRLDPFFTPAYVNLADLYRALGRDEESERILRDGLKMTPKSALLHHALGLALVRLKRSDAALAELEQARVLEPGNARFAYVYAVALHSTGKSDEAITELEKTLAAHRDDRDILEALVSFYGARGNVSAANRYQERLRKVGRGE